MNSDGRYNRSELYPLLARINHYIQRWLRKKYRRLRSLKALGRAWSASPGSTRERSRTGNGSQTTGGENEKSPVTGDCHAGILWEPGGEIPPGHPTTESRPMRCRRACAGNGC